MYMVGVIWFGPGRMNQQTASFEEPFSSISFFCICIQYLVYAHSCGWQTTQFDKANKAHFWNRSDFIIY